ncbi:MAG: FAD:protein FMN transferase, partial [Clostridia bacterium]|nr:FAD:protein FMN transferase [Clostridia bacterium]
MTRFGKRLSVLLLSSLLILPAGCSAPGSVRRSATYTDVFDTVSEFTAYGVTEETFDLALAAVHEELVRIHHLCDIYHGYDGIQNLFLINQHENGEVFHPDPDLLSILKTGERFYERTGGKLNIAMGSVHSIWHAFFEQPDSSTLPDRKDLEEASEHMGFSNVRLGGDSLSVQDALVRFDVGALAKGFAAEAAAAVARRYGLSDFALNLGGNVLVSGKKPTGEWTIGVQDPDGGVFTKLSLTDVS